MRTAASPGSSRSRRGKRLGIEQQEQVDVGRIIELAAAELAHGDDGKAAAARRRERVREWPRRRRRSIARSAKSDSSSSHLLKRKLARQIAKRHRKRQAMRAGGEAATSTLSPSIRQRACAAAASAPSLKEASRDLRMRSAALRAKRANDRSARSTRIVAAAPVNRPTFISRVIAVIRARDETSVAIRSLESQ